MFAIFLLFPLCILGIIIHLLEQSEGAKGSESHTKNHKRR